MACGVAGAGEHSEGDGKWLRNGAVKTAGRWRQSGSHAPKGSMPLDDVRYKSRNCVTRVHASPSSPAKIFVIPTYPHFLEETYGIYPSD
jgi:hypothetical protein